MAAFFLFFLHKKKSPAFGSSYRGTVHKKTH
jgi:hypothetical protein